MELKDLCLYLDEERSSTTSSVIAELDNQIQCPNCGETCDRFPRIIPDESETEVNPRLQEIIAANNNGNSQKKIPSGSSLKADSTTSAMSELGVDVVNTRLQQQGGRAARSHELEGPRRRVIGNERGIKPYLNNIPSYKNGTLSKAGRPLFVFNAVPTRLLSFEFLKLISKSISCETGLI